jgi:hypothetical protein
VSPDPGVSKPSRRTRYVVSWRAAQARREEARTTGDRTMSRKEEARRLANAALVVATNTSGKPAAGRVGSLDILVTTPVTGEVGMSGRYVVDIWSDSVGGRKVFSAYWNGSPDDESFGVVYFDRGPWSLDLQQAAEARAMKK